MNRTTDNIANGLRRLATQPNEIASGKVMAYNESEATVDVQVTGNEQQLKGVRLKVTSGAGEGLLLVPKVGSDVVIGSVDGPGEWVVLMPSLLDKVRLKMGGVFAELTEEKVTLQNGSAVLELDSQVKLNTASESLFDLLKDLLTYISALTVPTPSGPSGVPTNIADFTNLLTRLNNLLTH